MKNKKTKSIYVVQQLVKSTSVLLIFLFSLSGCQTTPHRVVKFAEQGEWKTRAVVVDKIKNRTNTIYIDVNSIKNRKIRLDMISGFIGHLASVVVDGQNISYLVPRQKKYFSGPMTSSSLKELLPMKLKPQLLYNIFFFEKIKSKLWSCGDKANIFYCAEKRGSLKITWTKNKSAVQIDHERGTIKIALSKYSPQLREQPNLFKLSRPKSW